MSNNIMQHYEKLVNFMGAVLGKNVEVALLDLSEDKRCITAIVNGHISGRKVGAPITDLARRIIAQESWKTSDCLNDYIGITKSGSTLRSSSFFIKEKDKLYGMLCFNVDLSEYQKVSDSILKLGGINCMRPAKPDPDKFQHQREVFSENINDVIQNILRENLGISDAPPDGFTQDEKINIVKVLNENGVFLIKGAVFEVAKRIGCSEPSIYRYLSRINRSEKTDFIDT